MCFQTMTFNGQRNCDSVNDGHLPLIHKADHLSGLHCRLVARHGAMPSPPDVVSLGLILMMLAFAVS